LFDAAEKKKEAKKDPRKIHAPNNRPKRIIMTGNLQPSLVDTVLSEPVTLKGPSPTAYGSHKTSLWRIFVQINAFA